MGFRLSVPFVALFGLVAAMNVNATLIGASVAADLEGESMGPMVIDTSVEFSFLDSESIKNDNADFDETSVTLSTRNLSTTENADFEARLWTFVFTDWPGIDQIIDSIVGDATNPSGAAIEFVSDDVFAIRLPETIGLQPRGELEWRFEIRTSSVPSPATLALLGLGLAGIGYQRRETIRPV